MLIGGKKRTYAANEHNRKFLFTIHNIYNGFTEAVFLLVVTANDCRFANCIFVY